MKFKPLRIALCLLMLLVATMLMVLPANAQGQVPGQNQSEKPSPSATPLLVPGTFSLYFEDLHRARTSIIYGTMRFFVVIEAPLSWHSIYATCTVFYPNGTQLTMFNNRYLGNGGTHRTEMFNFSRGDPEGQYLWRIELRYIDTTGMPQISHNLAPLQYMWASPYLPYPPYPPYTPTTPNIVNFSANPTTLKSGETATLTWNVIGATIITIEPGVGNVQSSGTLTVTPAVTTTYTLTASSYTGANTSRSISIYVEAPSPILPTPVQPPPVITTTPLIPTADSLPTSPYDSWPMYLLIGLLVVIIIAIIVFFMLYRKTKTPATPAAPIVSFTSTSPTIPPAKLVLPDNSELTMTVSTMPLGRSNFSRALPTDQLSYISRQHLQLSYEAGRYYIQDLRSMNGTKVNGTEIRGAGKREVRNGDTIELANVARLIFKTS